MLLATCFEITKASITAILFHHHDSRMAVRMLFAFALMEKQYALPIANNTKNPNRPTKMAMLLIHPPYCPYRSGLPC